MSDSLVEQMKASDQPEGQQIDQTAALSNEQDQNSNGGIEDTISQMKHPKEQQINGHNDLKNNGDHSIPTQNCNGVSEKKINSIEENYENGACNENKEEKELDEQNVQVEQTNGEQSQATSQQEQEIHLSENNHQDDLNEDEQNKENIQDKLNVIKDDQIEEKLINKNDLEKDINRDEDHNEQEDNKQSQENQEMLEEIEKQKQQFKEMNSLLDGYIQPEKEESHQNGEQNNHHEENNNHMELEEDNNIPCQKEIHDNKECEHQQELCCENNQEENHHNAENLDQQEKEDNENINKGETQVQNEEDIKDNQEPSEKVDLETVQKVEKKKKKKSKKQKEQERLEAEEETNNENKIEVEEENNNKENQNDNEEQEKQEKPKKKKYKKKEKPVFQAEKEEKDENKEENEKEDKEQDEKDNDKDQQEEDKDEEGHNEDKDEDQEEDANATTKEEKKKKKKKEKQVGKDYRFSKLANCHMCKRKNKYVYGCYKNWIPTSCNKFFCVDCLVNGLKENIILIVQKEETWKCPYKKNTCLCRHCLNKKEDFQIPLIEDENEISKLFGEAPSKKHKKNQEDIYQTRMNMKNKMKKLIDFNGQLIQKMNKLQSQLTKEEIVFYNKLIHDNLIVLDNLSIKLADKDKIKEEENQGKFHYY